ncbi:hypothetical protein L6R52_27565, partial [Myxococcota bacterium]|nr:hypothetical protein [Myxococcota bacterium]
MSLLRLATCSMLLLATVACRFEPPLADGPVDAGADRGDAAGPRDDAALDAGAGGPSDARAA